MTDSGRPQRHMLCFLSTLLNQKVPEKSDAVLRCMIAGRPKPEVTWYKNGQAIDEGGVVSSYEFFENQYIHLLHLSCCTQRDAAVYQVSARSCAGMICCSASIEVDRPPENPQAFPDLGDGRDTGDERETDTYEEESPKQTDQKGHPYKEEEGIARGAPMSADFYSASQCNRSGSPQILTHHDLDASNSEELKNVKRTKQMPEAYNPKNSKEIFLDSNSTSGKQHLCDPRTACATISGLMGGGLGNDDAKAELFTSNHQNHKSQKYISFSLPLSQTTEGALPADSALANREPSPQVSSDESDSDYELCPEITLTYTEEFSDDDLEYLECSDVMTDYSNAVWQRSLQGTDRVFLLESDDEEVEFNECGPRGCERFLSEMGRGPQVSDDTGPMGATTGFCGYHSQPREVGVRSSRASKHSLSPLKTGMTLTLGPHQDGTATVTEPGRCPLQIAADATENDCPGIQGETRASPGAAEEFSSDHLLTMDQAATEAQVKPLSGGFHKPGAKQSSESLIPDKSEERPPGNRRGAQRPTKVKRPGMKGNVKKQPLKVGAPESALDLLPREPAKYTLIQNDGTETPHIKPDGSSHVHEEQCAVPTQVVKDCKALPPPADSLSKEADASFQGEAMLVSNLLETSQVPDQTDPLQMPVQETVRERSTPSQMDGFSVEPAGLSGITSDFFSDLRGPSKEKALLAQSLALESCPEDPQIEDRQNKEGNIPCGPWAESAHAPSPSESNDENMSPSPPSMHFPQGASAPCRDPRPLSVASPGPTDPSLILEDVCSGSRGRETVCAMECFEAGDQGTCYDTMDPLAGVPVGKYLPQDICPEDSELTEGQSKVCDLWSPDKILAVLQTPGSEPPLSTCKCSKDGNSAESPLSASPFARNVSQETSEGAVVENLAEMEDSSANLSPTEQDGWEKFNPHDSEGLEETWPLSSEHNSLVYFNEGGVKSPSLRPSVATDTPANHSSATSFLQKQLTALTANIECPQVPREVKDILTGAVATQVHPTKYHAVSISENNHVDGADQSLPEAPDQYHFQFCPIIQSDQILSGSTTESTKELLCLAPGSLGEHNHPFLVPEGEGLCSNSLLQTDNQLREKSQTVDGADSKSLEEEFQEKGSETKQNTRPQSSSHKGSPSAHDFQESLPPATATQEETNVEPLECSPALSMEERGCSSEWGTAGSVVVQTTMEEDTPPLSTVPSLSEILLGKSEDPGLGNWEVSSKVKIITLEAPVLEIWPSKPMTDSEFKGVETGPTVPGRAWGLSDILKAGADMSEPDLLGVAMWAQSPKAETDRVFANSGETCDPPASAAHQKKAASQCLSQSRLLESSVDPIEEKGLDIIESRSEVSKTGGKENVQSTSQGDAQNLLKVPHSIFVNQFLDFPNILESSVDPIDDRGQMEHCCTEKPEPSESILGSLREGSGLTDGNLGQRTEVQPVLPSLPFPQDDGQTIPHENTINQEQVDSDRESGERESVQQNGAEMEVHPAVWQALRSGDGGQRIPGTCSLSQSQDGSDSSPVGAEPKKKDDPESVSPTSSLSSCLTVMTSIPVEAGTYNATGQIHGGSEPGNHQDIFFKQKERGTAEDECGKHVPSPSDRTQWPCISFPKGDGNEELKMEELQTGETKALGPSGSPTMTLAFISGECESERTPELLQDLWQKGSTLGSGKKSREEKSSRLPGSQWAVTGSEEIKKKQESSGSGHLAEGIKKKILSRVAALRLRLEEKENVQRNSGLLKKIPKLERSLSRTDERKDPKKAPCKRGGKAPVLLKKIQAEMSPDHSGNVKLSCQFAEIHEDSTIWWTKDSESIAQVQRSAGDNSSVSLAIVQAGQKDQGLYYCCIKNSYGKVTAEFNLTAEVLRQLSRHTDSRGCEEIEFSQLIFKEDVFNDSYFGDRLRGQIVTEELHFGEGVHRKAFRSTVMKGLMPVFQPGHACVLKVHNAVAHGTRNNDELVQRNYKLATQECYVQNTARYYAKIYAAEAQPLEGFGEVPEIIPIFLIHRPENTIPYATVEEELIGEFVKYSIRDGKEINFLRRDSEAGQKCCTFQHWVYQKTSGCLLVTDMQGVGMKLTDVGIATLAKGYKGFKGNCSMTFIDQFKALHQCNKYCKMLGLKSLQSNSQKPKKPSIGKSRVQTDSTAAKTQESGTLAEKKA